MRRAIAFGPLDCEFWEHGEKSSQSTCAFSLPFADCGRMRKNSRNFRTLTRGRIPLLQKIAQDRPGVAK